MPPLLLKALHRAAKAARHRESKASVLGVADPLALLGFKGAGPFPAPPNTFLERRPLFGPPKPVPAGGRGPLPQAVLPCAEPAARSLKKRAQRPAAHSSALRSPECPSGELPKQGPLPCTRPPLCADSSLLLAMAPMRRCGLLAVAILAVSITRRWRSRPPAMSGRLC